MLSVEGYLNKIKTYLKDVINNLRKSDTWKIQLKIEINFTSYKDCNDEERIMHTKIDGKEITVNDEADEVIEEVFKSFRNRYQNIMRGSEFVFNYIHLLHYKCRKINPNRGGSYIDSTDEMKNKKTFINPINKKDNKCFQ